MLKADLTAYSLAQFSGAQPNTSLVISIFSSNCFNFNKIIQAVWICQQQRGMGRKKTVSEVFIPEESRVS